MTKHPDVPADICDLIWRHWHAGTVLNELPTQLKPVSRIEGYAAQAHLEAYSPYPRAGWKIAATSVAGQRHIGVDGPLAGRLMAEKLYKNGATLSVAANRMRVAEPEFAFRFGQAVSPRRKPYSVEEVLALVSDLHPAIELPDSRFVDFANVGGPTLIADDACFGELVVADPTVADWKVLDLARHQVHSTVSSRYERSGIGANVLGDPRQALCWCVNEISSLGIEIRPGELITTGSCTQPLEIEPGDRVEADFGTLGKISVRIANIDRRK
jgi:2-keto-4-pentenoate hydratase